MTVKFAISSGVVRPVKFAPPLHIGDTGQAIQPYFVYFLALHNAVIFICKTTT